MPMLPIIGYPTQQPKWATTAANRSEPSESDKAAGHAQGQASPAYEENWRAYLVYLWTQKTPAANLMNWKANVAPATWNVYSAIYHPEIGIWVVSGNDPNSRYSYDGYAWSAGGLIDSGGYAAYRFQAIDELYYIMASDGTADDLKYTSDPTGAWSTIVSATIGGSGNMTVIATKYPTSRMCILSRNSGGSMAVRIASTTILGTWTGPTTPPPSVPTGAFGKALFWASGTTWLLLVNTPSADYANMKLYKSLDDGDTWANVSGAAAPWASGDDAARHAAYNPDTGRIVAVGAYLDTVQKARCVYSDDLGDTWTVSTINTPDAFIDGSLDQVYYCGGNAWAALWDNYDAPSKRTILISTDDGVNWYEADMDNAGLGTNDLTVMACDGRRMLAIGTNGAAVKSMAI